MTVAERFGRRLFVERRRLGITQQALADAAGLSLDCVHKLEKGARTARLDTVAKLADALGVDPAELVRGLRP